MKNRSNSAKSNSEKHNAKFCIRENFHHIVFQFNVARATLFAFHFAVLNCNFSLMMGNSSRCAMTSASVCGNCVKYLASSLQFLDSINADLLLDSGFKLPDTIAILCSKLLDYILLKSGNYKTYFGTSI